VTPSPLSMTVGQTTQLIATARDANGAVLTGRPVSWSSSNTAIAAVSAQGVVTAVIAGNTTITATSEGKSGTAALTVSNFPVGSVIVQPSSVTLATGASVQLSVVIRDVNGDIVTGRAVTWTSDGAVASVSQDGVV